jgi:selenocysteine lyase/cysteine desulfurase
MATLTFDEARASFPAVPGYLAACTLGLPTTGTLEALSADLAAWQETRTDAASYGAVVEGARRSYADLVGVSVRDVAIGSQTSSMVAMIAASVPDGAEILCVEGDFSSLVAPFLMQAHRGVRVRHAPLAELAEHVDASTWLVAYSAVQSATGAVADATAIRAAARAHGALTLNDLTQAAGWLPVDAAADDITVCHAYKWLCSPRGVAFLTVRDTVVDRLRPSQAGWYSGEDVWSSCYGPSLHLADSARRFDVSPAWQAWVGAAPAIALFAALDATAVYLHDTGLAASLRSGIGDRRPLLTGTPSAIVTWLDPAGEDLRAMQAAGISASGRAGRARVAFHLWNTDDDVAAVLEALETRPTRML